MSKELILERDERLALRAQAHHLSPVVLLGSAGLTEAAVKEIDRALGNHGLVKVHVAGDDREALESFYAEIAGSLGAARIQSIGKMLVFYRPVDEAAGVKVRLPGAKPAAKPKAATPGKDAARRHKLARRQPGPARKAGSVKRKKR
ncbi:MAG: YhbY family RNA-binding protein [Duodenibacillus sp.]|nr:YhbY family RNA-binding protein [Duodenibacillus sp.]